MSTTVAATAALSTPGEIAARLNRPIHKIQYVIKTRAIRPARRSGSFRLFDEAAVAAIVRELGRIDGRRTPA